MTEQAIQFLEVVAAFTALWIFFLIVFVGTRG